MVQNHYVSSTARQLTASSHRQQRAAPQKQFTESPRLAGWKPTLRRLGVAARAELHGPSVEVHSGRGRGGIPASSGLL